MSAANAFPPDAEERAWGLRAARRRARKIRRACRAAVRRARAADRRWLAEIGWALASELSEARAATQISSAVAPFRTRRLMTDIDLLWKLGCLEPETPGFATPPHGGCAFSGAPSHPRSPDFHCCLYHRPPTTKLAPADRNWTPIRSSLTTLARQGHERLIVTRRRRRAAIEANRARRAAPAAVLHDRAAHR
jgi:hypothetical protein